MCGGENGEMARVVLEIDDHWRYDGFVFDHENRHVELHVAHIRGRHRNCPDCDAPDQPVHDTKPRKWRHLHVGAASATSWPAFPASNAASAARS